MDLLSEVLKVVKLQGAIVVQSGYDWFGFHFGFPL
jgi:hypothetical protein